MGGRRSETLNNNPERSQPTVQRQPLNYNNNLGSSSTQGPAQTHVQSSRAPSDPPAAEDARKVDVNVDNQKNCSKTSNEGKKVGECYEQLNFDEGFLWFAQVIRVDRRGINS